MFTLDDVGNYCKNLKPAAEHPELDTDSGEILHARICDQIHIAARADSLSNMRYLSYLADLTLETLGS